MPRGWGFSSFLSVRGVGVLNFPIARGMGNSSIKNSPGFCTRAIKHYTQFYRIKAEVVQGARPPIIFEQQILPQQTIYHWKGNLTASRFDFKYWENILISRFYEQFSRNDPAMVPEQLLKKISNF